jgi:hypothetical protein
MHARMWTVGLNRARYVVSHGREDMVRFLCWWDAEAPEWRVVEDCRGRLPIVLARADSPIRNCLEVRNRYFGGNFGTFD